MFHVKNCFLRFFSTHLASLLYSSHTAPTKRPRNARELIFDITRAREEMRGGRVRGWFGHVGKGGR